MSASRFFRHSTHSIARRGSGFTLIELLVVIAIIAVLAALLMPAANRMVEEGRKTKCIANLRAIGIAIQQYAANNNGKIVNARVLPGTGGDYWPSILYRAGLMPRTDLPLGSYQPVFMCPTTAHLIDLKAMTVPTGYRINSRLAVVEPWSDQKSFLSISHPSKTSLVVDSSKVIGGAGGVAPWYASPGDILSAGVHGGRMNVLLCDGHVETMLPPKNSDNWAVTGPGGLFFTGRDSWPTE
jgi:prepilin-type N-terminal cleavage/methylation domain-containing protein/prepilin-type processing-associated H-X9-DG protein